MKGKIYIYKIFSQMIIILFSYYALKTSDIGFRKKRGIFCNYINNNIPPCNKKGDGINKNNQINKKLDIRDVRSDFGGDKKTERKNKGKFKEFENLMKNRVNSSDYQKNKNNSLEKTILKSNKKKFGSVHKNNL